MTKSKKILSILLALMMLINVSTIAAEAASVDPEALDAKAELVAEKHISSNKVLTPLPVGEAVASNEIIDELIIPTNNYLVGVSNYVTEIENPVASIEIISPPDKLQYIENVDGYLSNRWNSDTQSMEAYFRYDTENNRSGLEMMVNYTDGTSAIHKYNDSHSYSFNGSQISLYAEQNVNSWGLGEHEVTVSYMSRSTTFTVEVVANPVASIVITKMPDKREYIVGADNHVDPSGVEMIVHYTDGSNAVWYYDTNGSGLNGYNINITFAFNTMSVGMNTVTVTYMGKITTFEIEGIANPVERIEITKLPDKTEYIVGADYWVNLTGAEMTVHYIDGSSIVWRFGMDYGELNGYYININSYIDFVLGVNAVTVTYMGKTTTFDIVGIESPVEYITILSLPTDINYIVGEYANVDGLKLKIKYSDNTSKSVTLDSSSNEYGWMHDTCTIDGYDCNFSFIGSEQATIGRNTISIAYLGATTSFDVDAEESLMEHIEMVTEPRFINGKGMVIRVSNTDDSNFSLTLLEVSGEYVDYGENEVAGGGLAKTENGVFEYNYRINYEDFNTITSYSYCLNGFEITGNTLSLTSACWLSVDAYRFAGVVKFILGESGVLPNQEIDFNNINVMAHIAIFMQFDPNNYEYHFADNFEWYQIPIEDVIEMIDNVFDFDEFGLYDSVLYDNDKGTYTFVACAFGGGPLVEDIDVTVNDEGCYVIEYTRTDRTVEPIQSKTVYIVVTTENKIKSISEFNPLSTSTITFDCAGGSDLTPITQNEGALIIAPAQPTKAGYIFGGWSPEFPASMPVDDMTCVAQWFLPGDVSQNGPVTPIDALVALQACSNMVPLTPVQILIADVNGDGKLSVLDVLMILQYASGIITEFPSIPKST